MITLLGTILLVHLFALMSPGPDFVFVTRTAVVKSRGRALLGVTGITLGIVIWSGLSLLGLSVLFERFGWLQRLIAGAGGCYLLWMGVSILRAALGTRSSETAKSAAEEAAADTISDAATESGTAGVKHPFLYGLLTNLSNPKAVVYFGSIFSTFVTPNVDLVSRGLLFVLMAAESFLWFAFVALVFGSGPMREGYKRLAGKIDFVTGLLFGAFGIGLIVSALQGA